MAASRILSRMITINNVLTKVGYGGAILGGGIGIYESGKLSII